MRDANARMDQIEPGSITGRVFEWHPGGQLQPLVGTELSLPNGIEVSADGRYLFVTATFTQELVRFDRHATPISKRAVQSRTSAVRIKVLLCSVRARPHESATRYGSAAMRIVSRASR
jgi:sugar lactone lactonase YvrE